MTAPEYKWIEIGKRVNAYWYAYGKDGDTEQVFEASEVIATDGNTTQFKTLRSGNNYTFITKDMFNGLQFRQYVSTIKTNFRKNISTTKSPKHFKTIIPLPCKLTYAIRDHGRGTFRGYPGFQGKVDHWIISTRTRFEMVLLSDITPNVARFVSWIPEDVYDPIIYRSRWGFTDVGPAFGSKLPWREWRL